MQKPPDKWKCSYEGTLIDGTPALGQFYQTRTTHRIRCKPGYPRWVEALQIPEVAEWKLYIPSDLAYIRWAK